MTGHIASIARVVVDLILDDGKLRGHECFRGALEVEAVAFCQRVVKTVGTESLESKLISAPEQLIIINIKRTSKVDAGANVSICSAASPRPTRWMPRVSCFAWVGHGAASDADEQATTTRTTLSSFWKENMTLTR